MNSRFENMPARIAALPLDKRGFPIPFFVAYVNDEPVFHLADQGKLIQCVRGNRCWVCGQPMGAYKAFTIGPMCVINRISAEPPSHLECSEWSAQNCPFLSRPNMGRVTKDPEGANTKLPAGEMIKRNPGVTAVYVTRDYKLVSSKTGGLFQLGLPSNIKMYSRGRKATEQEILESIRTGLPELISICEKERTPKAVSESKAVLRQYTEVAMSNLIHFLGVETFTGLTSKSEVEQRRELLEYLFDAEKS